MLSAHEEENIAFSRNFQVGCSSSIVMLSGRTSIRQLLPTIPINIDIPHIQNLMEDSFFLLNIEIQQGSMMLMMMMVATGSLK